MIIKRRCWLVFAIIACYCAKESTARRSRACRTPNGRLATCTSIFECPRFVSAIQNRVKSQIRFIQQSRCGHFNKQLVCCGHEVDFLTTTKAPPDALENRIIPIRFSCGFQDFDNKVRAFIVGGKETQMNRSGMARIFGNSIKDNGNRNFQRNPSIPDRKSCGHGFPQRIFGGRWTTIDEFPWMALLQYVNYKGKRSWSCGGTLINNRYVLTAAHCVTGDILKKIGRLVNVRLGEYNTATKKDCQGNLCNSPEDIAVEEIIVHCRYNNSNSNENRYNDIALVRLSRPVEYTHFILPICLPRLGEAAEFGDLVTIAGWGGTEYSKHSSVKLKVEIPIADRNTCTKTFSSVNINLKSSQICAGGERGKDSCTGDSGGPLMKVAKDDSSVWYQEGIVSFGAKCGTKGWPGIYTKVESFLSWIHSNVRD